MLPKNNGGQKLSEKKSEKKTWRDLEDSHTQKKRMLLNEAIANMKKQKKQHLTSVYELDILIKALQKENF
jgi:hypothetical protein